MTDLKQRVDAVLALQAKARPGPWVNDSALAEAPWRVFAYDGSDFDLFVADCGNGPRSIGNGDFIAAAHTMADLLREQQEEIERLKNAVDRMESDFCALLPGVYYMDPPDGGSVSVLEQMRRMAEDARRYRLICTATQAVRPHSPHMDGTCAWRISLSLGRHRDIDSAVDALAGDQNG